MENAQQIAKYALVGFVVECNNGSEIFTSGPFLRREDAEKISILLASTGKFMSINITLISTVQQK